MEQNRDNALSVRISCIVLAASLLLTVIGCVWFASLANSMIERQERYEKAALILRVLRDCFDDAQDMETGQRGYLLTGKPVYLVPFNSGSASFKKHLAELDELVLADAPTDIDMPRKLASLMRLKEAELGATIELYRNGRTVDALEIVNSDQGLDYMRKIRALVNDYTDRYRLQRAGLEDVSVNSLHNVKVAFLIWVIAVATLVGAAFWKMRATRMHGEMRRA